MTTAGYRRLPPIYRRSTAGLPPATASYRRLPLAIAGLPPGLGVFNEILDFAQNHISNHFLEIQYAFPYVFQELVHLCIKVVICEILI